MGLFGKKKSLPEWKCARCGEVPNGDYFGFSNPAKDKPEWCAGCVFHKKEYDKKVRKRLEDLTALIAGRLAKDFPGLRETGFQADLVAAEAYKIAKAIMDLPGEGRGYIHD